MLQAVLQPGLGDTPAKFEETWNAREHQVDVYEKLATSKLEDDEKISVVLREAPTRLRDNFLVNSQLFESNCYKLRAIIQAYLNSNKSWTANDFGNDAKESDPMEVDHMSKGKSKRQRQRQRQRDEARQPRQRVLRLRKERALRARSLVMNKPRKNS